MIGIQQDLPHSTWRPVVRHRSLPMSLNTPLDFSHCIQEYVSRSRQSRMSGPSFPETAPANAGPIVDSKPNLFVAGRLTAILNERNFTVLIRLHRLGNPKEGKHTKSRLGRMFVDAVVLLSIRTGADTVKVLYEAGQVCKAGLESVSAKVEQEFAT